MERDKLDLGNEKIGVLFRAMFFPTLVGMFFNSILNIFDGMFVGLGVGSEALAAVNIIVPMFMMCTGVGLMFGSGASVIAGIRLAEGNVKGARIIMTQAYLAGAVIFGLVIAACLCFTHEILVYILGSSPQLESLARDYLLWLLPGLFFFYLQCVGMMLIRLDGSPKYAMSVQIVSAVLNIFLDWLMVYPLQMGIAGASVATSFSCIVGGSMVVVYFVFFSDKLKFYPLRRTRKSLMLSLRNVGYMAKIGLSTFISEISMGITIVTGNMMFLKYLGDMGVAAFSVGCYLFPIIFNVSYAVAVAAQPIISFNYGAKSMERVLKTLKVSLVTAVSCGLVSLCVMWIGAGPLARLFLSPDSAPYEMAVKGLPVLGLCTVFFAVNMTFIGYCQSTEKAGRAIFYTILRGIVFVVPAFVLLPSMIGDMGLWLSIPVAEFMTATLISVLFAWRRLERGYRA